MDRRPRTRLSSFSIKTGQILGRLQFTVLPGRCLLCQANTHRPMDLCSGCEATLPWIVAGCDRCGLPLAPPRPCASCMTDPPVFDACRSPFAYLEPVSSMILRFKHYQGFAQGKVLAMLMADYLARHLDAGNRPDLIVPVPSHWRRRWRRGFNQTELLARELSRELDIPNDCRRFRVEHYHPEQKLLGKAARRSSLPAPPLLRKPVAGLHIALLDDIVTTGTTASRLAALLKAAGAMEIEVWCLARTL